MKKWLLVVLPLVLGLAVHRDNTQMVPADDVEYPTPATSDEVAGVPGSGVVMEETGVAHHTATELAQDPCDMTGSTASHSPGEDPIPTYDGHTQDTGSQDDDGGMIIVDPEVYDHGLPEHEFVCRETVRFPEIAPPIANQFNLAHARFEGNDKKGAKGSTYEVADCACTCSGSSAQCGLPDSTSYYSEVPNAAACAQLICHANRYRKCTYRGEVVAWGEWTTNSVKFKSSELDLEPTELTTPPQVDIPVVPSPSPSPSASYNPSFQELVHSRALTALKSLTENFCINVTRAILEEIEHDLDTLDTSLPAPQCAFSADAAPTRVASVADIPAAAAQNNNVANAMAGYSGTTPLAADPTRQTSMAMNSPTGVLMQIQAEVSVEKAAFELLVALFEQKLPQEVVCASGSPSIRFLLVFGLNSTGPCTPAKRQRVLLQLTNGVRTHILSSTDVYVEIITNIRSSLRQAPTPILPRPPTTPPPVDLNGGEEEDDNNDQEDDGHGHDSENIANDMNPPLFPAGAPGPADVAPPTYPTSSMEEPGYADCEDKPSADLSANVESEQDKLGEPAGATSWPTFNVDNTRDDLPLFGRQPLQFEEREPLPVLTQPFLVSDGIQ